MRVFEWANAIAVERGWPAQYDHAEDLQIEIPTTGHRSQVVMISSALDRDGDGVAWIWSKVAEVNATPDPWPLLQLNAEITYGRLAVRDGDVVLAHALYDATADEDEVGKALYWVAQVADELEAQVYGIGTDVL